MRQKVDEILQRRSPRSEDRGDAFHSYIIFYGCQRDARVAIEKGPSSPLAFPCSDHLQPFLSIIHARCQEILASVFFFFPGFEVKVGVKWGDCSVFHTFFMESTERPCVFGGSVLQWNTVVFCHHIWVKEDGQKWQEN